MTTLDERFQKGIETRTKFGGGTLTGGSAPVAWEVAPDLNRIAGEFLFGSIWQRPALKTQHREMITLTILTVLKRDNQVRRHLGNALNLGLTPVQIVEVLMHSSFYSGVPATLDALSIAKEVFDEKGVDYQPQQVFDTSETPDDLFNRGVARRVEYMGLPASGRSPREMGNRRSAFPGPRAQEWQAVSAGRTRVASAAPFRDSWRTAEGEGVERTDRHRADRPR